MRYTDLRLIAGGWDGMAFANADFFIAFVISGSHLGNSFYHLILNSAQGDDGDKVSWICR